MFAGGILICSGIALGYTIKGGNEINNFDQQDEYFRKARGYLIAGGLLLIPTIILVSKSINRNVGIIQTASISSEKTLFLTIGLSQSKFKLSIRF